MKFLELGREAVEARGSKENRRVASGAHHIPVAKVALGVQSEALFKNTSWKEPKRGRGLICGPQAVFATSRASGRLEPRFLEAHTDLEATGDR